MAKSNVSLPVDLTSIPETDEEDSDAEYHSANSDLTGSHQAAPQAASPSDHQLPFNVMLTCYTLFERDSMDQQADRSFLRKWQWSHLALDEAHNLMCC